MSNASELLMPDRLCVFFYSKSLNLKVAFIQ
jgi:hypothetical protein